MFCFFLILSAVPVSAHLCNDVFEQAKDDLAVKVDIRDGQLRIDKEASFRVYLLNTMDRDIANINLSVESDAFDASVKPSGTWKKFPVLRTTRQDGQKEFFEVRLKRKKATPDGKYKINLTLFNTQNSKQVFKKLDFDEASDVLSLPKPPTSFAVDGSSNSGEWG
jgi:hypothetical protein